MTLPERREALLALAERVEAATGQDLDLDHEIGRALGVNGNYAYRPYTFSLDAAMTLVPEGWGWRVDGGTYHLDGTSSADMAEPVETELGPAVGIRAQAMKCATPALAICAAALRARSQTPGGEQ